MDGDIEIRLKTKKEKLEIKRDQEFYTLDFHPKKRVKNEYLKRNWFIPNILK